MLTAEEGAIIASIECKVGHEAARAIVHEDADLLARSALDHVEDDILQRGGLSDLPVNASALSQGNLSQIEDEVTDLAIKVVLVCVPVGASVCVRVRIDEGNALEARCTTNCGRRDGIPNQLSEVVLDDGRGDHVCAGREIDKSGSGSGRVTAETTARARRDGRVDCGSVVGRAVTFCSKVHDIAEDLIARAAAVRNCTAVLDAGKPVGGSAQFEDGCGRIVGVLVGGGSERQRVGKSAEQCCGFDEGEHDVVDGGRKSLLSGVVSFRVCRRKGRVKMARLRECS